MTSGVGVERAGATTSIARFDELLGRPVSACSIAVVRVLVGAVAVAHLAPIARDAIAGDTFHGRFHHPYVEAFARVPPDAYTVILVAGVVAAASMSVGFLTRVSTTSTFAVVAFHLSLSTTHVHNNRAYLVTVLAVLAMAPSGNVLSLDSARRRARGLDPAPATIPAWPLWLLRFECATVYGASGLSKLVDPDWFGGTVTWGRVVGQEAMVRASILPEFVVDLLLERSFHSVAAKCIVATELFIALGLWWRRTRPWALAAAIAFHVMIEFGADVQLFSWLGLAVLFVWADPGLPWLGSFAGGRPATDGSRADERHDEERSDLSARVPTLRRHRATTVADPATGATT